MGTQAGTSTFGYSLGELREGRRTMESQKRARFQTLMASLMAAKPVLSAGFLVRKRRHLLGDRAWRETVTHYTPEPWPIARSANDKRLSPA